LGYYFSIFKSKYKRNVKHTNEEKKIFKCFNTVKCDKWPPEIKNGYVAFLSTDHGSIAKYVCKSGFALEGPETIQCNFGSWGEKLPTCRESVCVSNSRFSNSYLYKT